MPSTRTSASGLGLRQVVVEQDRRGSDDVDVEADALQERVALAGQVERRRGVDRGEQASVEIDVAGETGLLDRHGAIEDELVALAGQPQIRIGQTPKIQRRVEGEVPRRHAKIGLV